MRKVFIIAPIFLLLINCSSFNSSTNARKGKITKTIVLDSAVEKSHILVTETILDPKKGYKSTENTTTEIEEKQFLFTYDDRGLLLRADTFSMQKDKKENQATLVVHLNAKKQITQIALDENENNLKVVYEGSLLSQISHYEPEFKELVVNTITYNKQKLPSKTQLSNKSKPAEVVNMSYHYDDKQNVKQSNYSSEEVKYTYDDKRYLIPAQPYYYNPFYYLSIDWLTFTNYSPKNNITSMEDNEYITTIDYTYNDNNLPSTALVTKTSKANKQDSRITSEYEFFYKEIVHP